MDRSQEDTGLNKYDASEDLQKHAADVSSEENSQSSSNEQASTGKCFCVLQAAQPDLPVHARS